MSNSDQSINEGNTMSEVKGMQTRAIWNGYRIQAIHTGSKAAPWDGDWENRDKQPTNWNHHRVTVTAPKNGKLIRFDFWASLAHPIIKEESEVLEAFSCFLGDAVSGTDTFENFCNNLGYGSDSIRAFNIFKACQRAFKKATRIIGSEDLDVLCTLADDLREKLDGDPS